MYQVASKFTFLLALCPDKAETAMAFFIVIWQFLPPTEYNERNYPQNMFGISSLLCWRRIILLIMMPPRPPTTPY
jgi:hypothetical protein